MDRIYSMHGRHETPYNILIKKSKNERPLRRYKCRCEDNIKIGLKTGHEDVDQDRVQWRALVNTMTNIRVPCTVGSFLNRRARSLLKKNCVSWTEAGHS
jgi:hypothetical protein